MNRKVFRQGILLITVFTMLAACVAPPATNTNTAPAQPAPTVAKEAAAPAASATNKKYEPITVGIWSGPEHDNLVKVAAEYEKQTGNKIVIEEIAREALQEKITAVLLAGGSDYDAVYISGDWIPGLVAAEGLQPLNPFIDNKAVADSGLNLRDKQPGLDYASINGKIYGFPSEGDTAWFWYREDLLKAKGIAVPTTWDEVYEAAKKLNDPSNVYGIVIGAKRDEAAWDFMHYFYSFGAEVWDAQNKKVIFNNEAGLKAMNFYARLMKEKLTPPDVTTYGYNEILAALQQGKAAMGVEWMAATKDLTDCTVSPKVCNKLKFTFIPGDKGPDGKPIRGQGASSWAWSIPKGSKNSEAAYKFVEWLTGNSGAKLWALNGGIPSNTAVLQDAEVVKLIPQFKMLGEIMPYRHLLPNTTVTPAIADAFHEAVSSVIAGTKEPKAAMDDTAAKMTEALTKGGYTK